MFSRLGGEVLGVVEDKYPESREVSEERFNKLVDLTVELRDKARRKQDFETNARIHWKIFSTLRFLYKK